MNWKYIFNPFLKYSERQLFVVGILGFVAMSAVCIFIKEEMDGILHWGDAGGHTIQQILLINLGIMLSTILIYFVFGKIINRSTRLIDVANAFLLSTIPSTLVLLWGKIPLFHHATQNLGEIANDKSSYTLKIIDLIIASLSALVAIPLIIYIVILMFNGFKTAANMKKTWQIIAFFVLLFILNSITQTYF